MTDSVLSNTDAKMISMKEGGLAWGATNSGKTYRNAKHFVRRCALRPAKHLLIGANLRLVRGEVIPLIRYHAHNYGIKSTPYNGQLGNFTVGDSLVTVVCGRAAGDEDRLRTYHNIDSIMAEEITAMPETFYDMALTRRGPWLGPIWASCNPSHPLNWVKVRLDANRWFHDEMFLVSDNPSLTPEERAAFEAQFVGVFRLRMIEALWAAPEGLIYPNFKRATPEQAKALQGRPCFAGADYGRSSVTCAYYAQMNDEGNWVITRGYYHDAVLTGKPMDSTQHAALIVDRTKFAPGPIRGIYVDPSARDLRAALNARGVSAHAAYNDWDGYGVTDGMFQRGKLLVCTENNPELFAQLMSLVYNKYGDRPHPEAIDHATDAVRYLANGISELNASTYTTPAWRTS